MATVGQTLSAPESGWRRLDDTYPIMTHYNYGTDTNAGAYGGSYKYPNSNAAYTQFNFTGDRIRVIISGTVGGSCVHRYTVDGVDYTYDYKYTTTKHQILALDLTGLDNKEHTIKLTYSTASGSFDAVDIASDAYILPYNTAYNLKNGAKICKTLDEMAIGDIIPVRYTAASNTAGTFSEIGTCTANDILFAAPTTPDGLFFARKVDTGTLVSDRVLQTSVSYNSLNAAGYIYGTEFINGRITTPKLTGNTCTVNGATCTVTSSSKYSGYEPWNVFAQNGYTGWLTNNTSTGYVKLDAGKLYNINCYGITPYSNGSGSTSASSWRVSVSTDDINWTVVSEVYGASYRTQRFYALDKTYPYRYILIELLEKSGTEAFNTIGEFTGYEGTILRVRSLSGGCAYINASGSRVLSNQNLGAWPANNEWDTYIVKSDLNGKIDAGSDGAWHWNAGVATYCQEAPLVGLQTAQTPNCNGSEVILRGSSTATNVNAYISSGASPSFGFRPVIEYIDKYSRAKSFYN